VRVAERPKAEWDRRSESCVYFAPLSSRAFILHRSRQQAESSLKESKKSRCEFGCRRFAGPTCYIIPSAPPRVSTHLVVQASVPSFRSRSWLPFPSLAEDSSFTGASFVPVCSSRRRCLPFFPPKSLAFGALAVVGVLLHLGVSWSRVFQCAGRCCGLLPEKDFSE